MLVNAVMEAERNYTSEARTVGTPYFWALRTVATLLWTAAAWGGGVPGPGVGTPMPPGILLALELVARASSEGGGSWRP